MPVDRLVLRNLCSLSILVLASFLLPLVARGDEPPLQSVDELSDVAKRSVVIISFQGRDGRREGMGTGFVIKEGGFIATNLHVIGEARPIQVTSADGMSHEVLSIHASDRHRDLAILQIKDEKLPPLPLGNSDDLKEGEAVIAIGNPHGLAHSVVSGVVSAKREIDGRPMIQLAIPIEPGNSGGPLLDMRGRVHGVLTMKSAVTENLGFAVTSNSIKPLLEKPNPIPMARWLTIGALNPSDWTVLFGARWRQRAGRLLVEGIGSGFGGRSLCLSEKPPLEPPFEIGVAVRLEDESGAAGLVFDADGNERHFGFYPSGGRLRLSRFEGPDVASWRVLQEVASPDYHPREWNYLKVRVEADRILAFVNDAKVVEIPWVNAKTGKVGLAKFRDTRAEFKQFSVARELQSHAPAEAIGQRIDALMRETEAASGKLLEELSANGDASVSAIRQRALEFERKAARLKEMARTVHEKSVHDELAKELCQGEEKADLLRCALLLAKLDNEDVDVDAYVRQVDEMAEEIRRSLAADADERTKLVALDKHLFEQLGYHGSRVDYYSKSNSYLNEVLDDREGLPISLSVLYMELARRLGAKVEGIGLPGHFVVRSTSDSRTLIDVFDHGKRLSMEEASQRVTQATGHPPIEEHLRPMTKVAILARMTQNLLGAAQDQGDAAAMARYLDTIILLVPTNSSARLMRALLHFQSGRKQAALLDTKWLLDHQPDGIDLERVLQFQQMIEQSGKQPGE
ncbi:MAG: transglutaminase family protein [Planctomycetota bacterium]